MLRRRRVALHDEVGLIRVLAGRHRFDPTDEEAISIWDVGEGLVLFQTIFLGFRTVLAILGSFTLAVAAIGGISLVVGGVGILTILTIAVAERTSEIGLLRAVGATRRGILLLFLGEAALLSVLGGTAGLLLGWLAALALNLLVPALPVHTPWIYALLAELVALAVGLSAGVLPARRASLLDPLEALRSE